MLLVVAITGAAVFSLIGERESKVDVSGFGDDDLQVTEFETANDGNLSLQVRHLDRETASIKSVNLSTDTGDKELSVKGDKDVGSIDANNFQLCSKTGNITADSGTLEIVYDGEFNDLISEGEITGDINIQECKSSTESPALFTVTVTDINSSVNEGEKIFVDYEIENTGDVSGTQTINFTVNGTQNETKQTTLNAGQNISNTFNYTTDGDDYPARLVNVSSDNETVSNTVTVNAEIAKTKAIHRWKLNDVASGKATDSIGGANGTVNGVSSVSGDYQGGSAGDGTEDYISAKPKNFLENADTDFAVGLTINYSTLPDSSKSHALIGMAEDLGDGYDWWIIAASQTSDGTIGFDTNGLNGNDLTIETTNSVGTNTNVRVLFNKKTNDASNFEVYFNNTAQSLNILENNSGYSGPQFNGDLYFFGYHDIGLSDGSRFQDVIMDDVIFYDSSLSSSEIQDDYNAQPWS
jgi:hypothetical protein